MTLGPHSFRQVSKGHCSPIIPGQGGGVQKKSPAGGEISPRRGGTSVAVQENHSKSRKNHQWVATVSVEKNPWNVCFDLVPTRMARLLGQGMGVIILQRVTRKPRVSSGTWWGQPEAS